MRVLVVEDNPRMVALLAEGLRESGYDVDTATDGESGLRRALDGDHDAIVLDLMLPKLDGMTVLDRLRRQRCATPVLILTARDEVDDRVRGLDTGADDYLAKPFAFDELLARLRAIIRRRHGGDASIIRIADLEVDTAAKTATRGGEAIALSAREYAILEALATRRGRVVTRDQLLDAVYAAGSEPTSNVVDVYVGYLRKKIDRAHARKLIHTRRGLGYVLEDTE